MNYFLFLKHITMPIFDKRICMLYICRIGLSYGTETGGMKMPYDHDYPENDEQGNDSSEQEHMFDSLDNLIFGVSGFIGAFLILFAKTGTNFVGIPLIDFIIIRLVNGTFPHQLILCFLSATPFFYVGFKGKEALGLCSKISRLHVRGVAYAAMVSPVSKFFFERTSNLYTLIAIEDAAHLLMFLTFFWMVGLGIKRILYEISH